MSPLRSGQMWLRAALAMDARQPLGMPLNCNDEFREPAPTETREFEPLLPFSSLTAGGAGVKKTGHC